MVARAARPVHRSDRTGRGSGPVSCVLTSASLHDSQAAIPLARMTGERLDHCYELMDAAYDSREIGLHARMAGHVRHDRVRHGQRSSVERVNSALKDSYGGRHVRVRGNLKVACHLMFGVLVLTVDRLMRLIV